VEASDPILILVNPAAGGGRVRRVWPRLRVAVRRHLAFEEHWTSRPGEATTVASQAAHQGFRRILAVGGDGTLHEIVNGLDDDRIAVAALPVGTGNDFARVVGWRLPLDRLLPALCGNRTRSVDIGNVNGVRYLLVAGVGFDAAVARDVQGMTSKGRGTLPYLSCAVREAFRFESPRLTLELDGRRLAEQHPFLMVAAANTRSYAGGMQICPPARPDDGLLHVVSVESLSGWRTLLLLARVYRGGHLADRRVRVAVGHTLRIEGPAAVPIHADGEPVGSLPATFRIHPAALRLWGLEDGR
jgi:diacylglycerol kinase (ATP)